MSKNVVMVIAALVVVLLLCFYLQSVVVKQLTPPEPTGFDTPATKTAPLAPAASTPSSTKTKISAPSKRH
jgi:hypothetical protein